MKKILLAFNGTQFSEGAFAFVSRLNEQSPLLLTGLFLPQLTHAGLWSYASAMSGLSYLPQVDEDADALQKNIELFETKCRANGIAYRVHQDYYDFALPELKKETRFADLLVLSSEKSFYSFQESDTDPAMNDVLHLAECPVVVVPETFSFPEKNILAYDGSESSVYAIKMFAYLLPQLCTNETLLLYSDEQADPELPSQVYIEELAAQHFPNLELGKVSIYPDKYFTEWIAQSRNALLVSGSFGRSALSQLFKKSFIANIITEHRLPVFIAHC
jgi:hypothetical protein